MTDAARPILFDRELRRLRRSRGARLGGAAFMHERAFADLVDRLGDVRRRFGTALLFGCGEGWRARLEKMVGRVVMVDPSPDIAMASDGVAADEDRLPFADGSFDLVINVGTLDSIDDLPGALLLMRRILRPDGLLLAALSGAGSLPRLRGAMLAADQAGGGAAARMHPAIDVRTAGDLLSRAGFKLPVAEIDGLDASYAGLPALIADLRRHGATNILHRRSKLPLSRRALTTAADDFVAHGGGGRTIERFETLYLSGWSPAAGIANS